MKNDTVVIREYEEIISDNMTILNAYENSKKAGNARLDFNDVIWDEDIKAIADTLRKSGIKEFTISIRQESGKSYWEVSNEEVNRTLFNAYHASKRYGNTESISAKHSGIQTLNR